MLIWRKGITFPVRNRMSPLRLQLLNRVPHRTRMALTLHLRRKTLTEARLMFIVDMVSSHKGTCNSSPHTARRSTSRRLHPSISNSRCNSRSSNTEAITSNRSNSSSNIPVSSTLNNPCSNRCNSMSNNPSRSRCSSLYSSLRSHSRM